MLSAGQGIGGVLFLGSEWVGVSRSLWCRRGSAVACCRVGGTECSSACMGPFEESHLYYLLPPPGDSLVECSSDGKESAYNEGDTGSIPGSGRSPGEGSGNPLQYSCLENPMD